MRQALRGSLLAMLATWGLLVAPAAAQQGTITGRVTESDTGQPVANAEVHARAGGRSAAVSITNADGRYRLSVAPGTYDLHVESVGYEAFVQRAVQVSSGGAATADVALATAVFQLNPVVVSASKRVEKATESAAHVEAIGERDIAARPTVTPVDHLRSVPGVDVLTSGVQSTNVVVRGFNNIFSGSLHALTDHRIAGIPSLRVNFMHFIQATDDDLQRMEIVLGPGSALYGPNTASGVLHMITKSPLLSQGTTVAVSGGSQDLMQAGFRTAHRLGERLGFKLSGQYMQAKEYQYTDPVEASERANYTGPQAATFEQILMATLDQIPATDVAARRAEAQRRIALIGNRDFDVERWSGEARADFLATEDLTLVLQGGITAIGNGVELTGLGAGQAQNWKYSYVQGRANMGRLFAQAYLNLSDAGDTYLLRNGTPIVDKSKLLVAQLQHGYQPSSWLNLTYGLDYLKTMPETEGSINGVYEDEDETTEVGGYLQAQVPFHPRFELVAAARLDDHSALPDPVFSPRLGLIFKAAENRSLRVTYNRAFSTPSSLNQFLDLSSAIPDAGAARLGYSVRVQGTGTNGFSFGQPGAYQMRSPFLNNGQTPVPATASAFWPAAVQVVAQQAAARGTPLPAPLVTYLAGLRPTEAQIRTTFRDLATGQIGALAGHTLPDVPPIRESTTSTFEVGYRGVILNRLLLAGDVWWQKLENFVTPLTAQTPLIRHDSIQAIAYITQAMVPFLTQAYMAPPPFGPGLPAAAAAAKAQQDAPGYGQQIGSGIGQVPVGVIASPDMHASGAQVLTTYYNVEDEIDLRGIDLAVTYLLTNNLSLGGTMSLVNEDIFTSQKGEKITLNAPKTKWTTTGTFRKPEWGFDTELRVRYNSEFPVRSGVYNGTQCIGGQEPGNEPCVDSYTLVDLNASYQLPGIRGATLQFYAQNLLNEGYRSYPGVPTIGRMLLTRLKYTF